MSVNVNNGLKQFVESGAFTVCPGRRFAFGSELCHASCVRRLPDYIPVSPGDSDLSSVRRPTRRALRNPQESG